MFFKSYSIMTQPLCFDLAWFMISNKHLVCSIQLDIFSQKPFWRFVLMYLFFEVKLKSLFWMMEVNTFNNTVCRVIWWKFSGFPASTFLYVNTVTPDFHTSGSVFAVQAVWRIFLRRKHRIGCFLKTITLIWSRGQGDADGFIFTMTFVTSA